MNRQRAIIDRMYQSFKDCIFDDVPALHQKELIDFHKSSHGEHSLQQDVAFNHWLYQKNTTNKRFYCYRDKQVVGQQSAMEVELKMGDKIINAAYAIELWVRPEWKMKGLGVAMIGALIDRYDVLIGLGVSDDAHKMFKRQGWLDLGMIDLLVKPLDLTGLSKRTAKTGIVRKLEYVAALVASKLSNVFRRRVAKKSHFKKISRFTDQHAKIVDELYAEDVITAKKKAEYFNWRFLKFPNKNAYDAYELVVANKPTAFFVVRMDIWKGAQALIISEIHAEKSDLGVIIDEIVVLAIFKNVSMIIYQGLDENIKRVLKSRLFFNHPGGERLLVYTKQSKFEPLLRNKKNWRICNADSDVDLFINNIVS